MLSKVHEFYISQQEKLPWEGAVGRRKHRQNFIVHVYSIAGVGVKVHAHKRLRLGLRWHSIN